MIIRKNYFQKKYSCIVGLINAMITIMHKCFVFSNLVKSSMLYLTVKNIHCTMHFFHFRLKACGVVCIMLA